MKNEITCDVCRDLIPLVRDDIASADSCEAVKLHTENCEDCRALLADSAPPPPPDGEKLLERLRRQARIAVTLLLTFAIFTGAGMTSNGQIFYNSILMPAVGAVGYGLFGKKAFYRVPLLILLMNVVVNLLGVGMPAGGGVQDIFSVLVWSMIYSALAFAGMAAAFFTHNAFGGKKERREKRRGRKAVFITIALVLVAGICLFANALVGNPISHALAERSAEKHLAEQYADTDYQLTGVSYSFKTEGYLAYVGSPKSADSTFTLWLDGLGHVLRDDYESRVENRTNTASRLSQEYRNLADDVLESPSLPFVTHLAYGYLEFLPRGTALGEEEPSYGIEQKALELDGLYDIQELGAEAGHLIVYVDDDDVSAARAAEVLTELRRMMEKSGVPFYAVDLVLEPPMDKNGVRADERIELRDFRCADIEGGDLAARVQEANDKIAALYAEMEK